MEQAPRGPWINPVTGKDLRDSEFKSQRVAAWRVYWKSQDSKVSVRYYVMWGRLGEMDVLTGPSLNVWEGMGEGQFMRRHGWRPRYRIIVRDKRGI